MVRERTERKRERAESATTLHIRGGIGVRKKLEEQIAERTTFRLHGVQVPSVVLRAHDKYHGDFSKGYDVGVLLRKTALTVFIRWVGDDDISYYNQGDATYEVYRGRWKFVGPPRKDPLKPEDPLTDRLIAMIKEFKRQGVTLTENQENAMMRASANAGDPPPTEEDRKTEEEPDMAREQSNAAAERAAAKKALKEGSLTERETYTAKQVATRCGTDAKTMRKFFRSSHSTIEPVGQGGRYEFAATDMPQIQKEFKAWLNRSSLKKRPAQQHMTEQKQKRDVNDTRQANHQLDSMPPVEDDDPDFVIPTELNEGPLPPEYELPEEPSADDLKELEELELDLDDLDAED